VPHLQHVRRVEWAADGQSLLISGNRDGKETGVFRVDPETGSASPVFVGIPPIPFCLSADGRTLYFAGDKSRNNVIALDLLSHAERSVHRVKPWISQLKLSRDGRLAVMTASSIDVVDVAAGTVRLLAARPAGGQFSGGDWAPDGRWFFATVSYGVEARAELWRIPADGGAPWRHPLGVATTGGWLRPDGREYSMMRTERREQVWRIENFLPPMTTSGR
jgi:sugar lactone lactonase YvrE